MFVGLDVHKHTIKVFGRRGDRRGEVRHFGVIASDLEPLDKVVRALRESQSMALFEHTEQAFAPDTPSLAASEPAWTFIRAPRGRLGAAPRQDHWRTPQSVAACSLVAEVKPD